MEKTECRLNDVIAKIIDSSCLTPEKNSFFTTVANKENFTLISAYYIALKWREITKNFLFTSIVGIGNLAERISYHQEPSTSALITLQTVVSIISDDLYSANVNFHGTKISENADKAHYRWWEKTILNPLSLLVKPEIEPNFIASKNIELLIKKMKEYSNLAIGVIIQLRIVESIASDICIAFKKIFSHIEYNNARVFKSDKELAWIFSHINAELIHQKMVETSLLNSLPEIENQLSEVEFLNLTKEYCNYWNNALSDFASYLNL